MRKLAFLFTILFTILTIAILSACQGMFMPNPHITEAKKEALKSSKEAQVAYFECLFEREISTCREGVWSKYPQPIPDSIMNREFIDQYLADTEKLGAGEVLRSQRYECDEIQKLRYVFWRDGYQAICSNGTKYEMERIETAWRIKVL